MKLEIIESERIDDKTGKTILVFTPKLTASITAQGELLFSRWEEWADAGSETIVSAKYHALANARNILESLTRL